MALNKEVLGLIADFAMVGDSSKSKNFREMIITSPHKAKNTIKGENELWGLIKDDVTDEEYAYCEAWATLASVQWSLVNDDHLIVRAIRLTKSRGAPGG